MSIEAGAPRKSRLLVLLPLAAFAGLAAIFLAQLMSGRDTGEIPSALIGQPAPATKLAALDGAGAAGPRIRSEFKGKVTRAQRLGVVVRALPRGASAAAWPRRRQPLRARRAELQGPDRPRPEIPGRVRQPVRRDRRRSERPQRDRLGRLRRPRDIHHRQGRQDRLQACRAADGRSGEGRVAARDREGAGGRAGPDHPPPDHERGRTKASARPRAQAFSPPGRGLRHARLAIYRLRSAVRWPTCSTKRRRPAAASLSWPGDPREDALSLRFCGGLHALVLSGTDEELAAAYPPACRSMPRRLARILPGAISRNDAALGRALGQCAANQRDRALGHAAARLSGDRPRDRLAARHLRDRLQCRAEPAVRPLLL